jgi:hypothetical protein
VRLNADGILPLVDRGDIMRTARKLTLLAMAAIAATALAAPSALAQVEPLAHNPTPRIGVVQEVHAASDPLCPAVAPSPTPVPNPIITTGGCRLHVAALGATISSHLSAGGAEVLVATCDWEFNMRVDAAGEGYMSHQEPTGDFMTCTRKACGQPNPTSEGKAWSFFLRETEPAPRETVTILFCFEGLAGENPAHCEVTLPVSQPSLHRYRFTATDASGHGTAFPHCEVSGTFDVEAVLGNTLEAQAEQNVEIRHS